MATEPNAALDPSRNAFGTFGGVFTPSILTILGVIMFMRTGYVVGEAGVLGALAILTLASAITFLTGLSISAISTNVQVEGGGAYFLISRSLGPAYGGAIGLALFLAQALSVPFYILGFVEAFVALVPSMSEHFFVLGAIVTAVLYVVNIVGANLAIKAQYFILAVLVASVVAFLSGGLTGFSIETMQTNANPVWAEDGLSFWMLFAVFFPAVTGIMAGVNMSGDLKDPAQSIPKGTLAAIGVGFIVYALQIVITGGAIERQTLIDEPYNSLLAQAIFGFSPVVVAGVFAATLSSALGSFLGAPRILQALARDGVFPVLRPFAKGTAKGDEPRRGLTLTAVLTIGVLYAAGNGSGGGALNAVAAVLTMFFLYTYGVTNLAAFIEHITRNPSFRPRFRYFHWSTALAGAAGCVFAAVLINPIAAVVSLALVAVVFIYIENRMLETTFGDARRGFFYARTRTNLTKLVDQTPHPKNWRPTALVLSGNPKHRTTLTQYAAWMESGRGIVTLAQVIVGRYEDTVTEREQALESLTEYIAEHRLAAFPEVVAVRDFDAGLAVILQAHSLGPLKPNLIVLGAPASAERAEPFGQHLRMIESMGKSMVVVLDRGLPTKAVRGDRSKRRIDVWWRGHQNGSLMVILAYLITLNFEWGRTDIRILRTVTETATAYDVVIAEDEIRSLIDAARITADVHVLRTSDFAATLTEQSADATVVMLGLRPPARGFERQMLESILHSVNGLPTTLLVSSSGDADVFA